MKQGAYQRQLILYLKNKSYQQAYEFAKQYVAEYPEDMIAHFLLAKSSVWAGNFEEAAHEARIAYNMADSPEDMMMCGIHACVAYYKLKEFAKGFELLRAMERIRICEESEQLFFLFSLALDNAAETSRHFKEMFRINNDAATVFLRNLAGDASIDYEKLFQNTDRI